MNIRRTYTPTLAAFIVMALPSCSSGDEPEKPAPTPSAAAARTSPPPADADSTIRAWLSALVEMQNSGESEPFRSLSAPDCSYCLDFSEEVHDVYASGGSATVDATSVRNISPVGGDSETKFVVQITTGSGVLQRDAESKEKPFPGGDHTYLVEVRKEADSWLVHDVLLAPSS